VSENLNFRKNKLTLNSLHDMGGKPTPGDVDCRAFLLTLQMANDLEIS
jgi:hypothetical protein